MSLLAPAALAAVSRRIGFAGTPAAAPPPTGYTALVDALSPASHYPMDEASGTTVADRKGVQDGTLSGTVQYFAETLAEDDDAGRAIGFDGSTTRLAIPHAAAHKPAGGGGIAFLMHADRLSLAQQILVCSDSGAQGGFSVELKYSRVTAYVRDGTGTLQRVQAWRAYQHGTHPFRVGIGSTHHVAFTWGPAGLRLYVDGVLEAYNASTAVPSGNVELSIGAWHNGTVPFDGVINHLVAFGSQPSTAEVATLARARQGLDHTPDFTIATVTPGQAGVVGGGGTDDGPEIRTILGNLLAAAGPKKLKFTSGHTYLVQPSGPGSASYAGRVPIFNLDGVSDIAIQGTDPVNRPIIKLGDPPSKTDTTHLWHPIFLVHGASIGVEFRDLEIDGNRTAYFDGNVTIGVTDGAMCGITIDGSDVTCVRRCFIHHCHADNVLISHDALNGSRRCREARICHNTLTWGRRQGWTIEDTTDCECDHNEILDSGRPIGANAGEAPKAGIDSEGWTDLGEEYVLVHDCDIQRSGTRGIVIEGFGDSNFRSGGSARRFWRIWGNTIRDNGLATSASFEDIMFSCRPQTNMFIEDIEIRENTIGQKIEASWTDTAGPLTRITIVDNTFENMNPSWSGGNIDISNAVALSNSTIRRNATPKGVTITTNNTNCDLQTGSETPTPEEPPS